jgi:hypothetical protein
MNQTEKSAFRARLLGPLTISTRPARKDTPGGD